MIGRLTKDPEIQKIDGKTICRICLAVKRQFKNIDGIYETDFITCTVWNVIAERVFEFCKKGDMISVKGRLQNNNYINKDDAKVYTYDVVAEQISFMQTSTREEDADLENV